jgi:hypothetical protein
LAATQANGYLGKKYPIALGEQTISIRFALG